MQVTIGGLDDGDGRDGDLRLPFLRSLPSVARVEEALDDACTRRVGVLLVGDKGSGKSKAKDAAVAAFDRAERERETLDDGYRRRLVVEVPGLYTTRYRDALTDLLHRVTGIEHRRRVHGEPVTEDALLERLVLHCQEERVAAFAIDDAERIAPAVLVLLRDLMAKATSLDPSRADADGVRAAGVGVLLLGTRAVRRRIAATEEHGHRWARVVAVDGVPADAATSVYEQWFPGFRTEIAARGREWWTREVERLATAGQTVAIRSLDHHARLYWRYLVHADPTVTAREDAPLRPEIFAYAAQQVPWQRSAGDAENDGEGNADA